MESWAHFYILRYYIHGKVFPVFLNTFLQTDQLFKRNTLHMNVEQVFVVRFEICGNNKKDHREKIVVGPIFDDTSAFGRFLHRYGTVMLFCTKQNIVIYPNLQECH